MKSLQHRLSLGLFISLICVFAVLWWLTGTTLRFLAEEYLTEHLEHDGESILGALAIDQNNNISLELNKVEPVYQRLDSGQYYSVISAKTIIRSPSLRQLNLNVPVLKTGQTYKSYQEGPNRQPLLIRAQYHQKQGLPVTIVTAEDLSPTLNRIASVQHRYSLIAMLLLLLLIGIQVLILRSGFYPLIRIRTQLHELEQGTRQVLDTNVPMEVVSLVTEVNWLLQVLQQRLQHSRNTLSDLAHALKTPLTVIQQLADEKALQQHPEIHSTLLAQTTNMQRFMDRVLKRGRLAGQGPATQNINISQELTDLVNALRLMYRDKHLNITLNIGGVRSLPIDREDMLELAGNLIDNACKWADRQVNVNLSVDDGLQLIIEDDGPGVADNDFKALSERGKRMDESVTGHGLGLAIAQYIVEQYNGNLSFSRSPELGGFCVSAALKLHGG